MNEIKTIIKQICAEKGISEESVYETINSALGAAYRKDFGDKTQNIVASYNVETGETKVFDEKLVVEDLTPEETEQIEKLKALREARRVTMEETGKMVSKDEAELALEEIARKFNPKTEIELHLAKETNKKLKVGDVMRTELDIPGEFGRMAAQTAKQVIIQRLREAERDVAFNKFKGREGEMLFGIVQKYDGHNVLVDIDHVTAVLPPAEQVRTDRYRLGERIKVILIGVTQGLRGPEIIVSRATPIFIEKIFETEIPEISNGVITIKGIAREPGSRSKVAVATDDENIDPIGSCIGQRGARIQTIIQELNGEKIDIIEYSDKPEKYIAASLAPAKVATTTLDNENKVAFVTVPAEQLSLTIGREGQNVRLAVRLTGWKINIREKETGKEVVESEKLLAETTPEVSTEPVVEEAKPAKVKKAKKATKESKSEGDKEVKEKKTRKKS